MTKIRPKPYIMTHHTYVLIGTTQKEQQQAIIYDMNGKHLYDTSTSKIIRATARHYGHTLKSLTQLSRQFFKNDEQKIPLCLTTSYNGPCIFFPLWSHRTTANIWINAHAITNITQQKDGVKITLKDQFEIDLPVQSTSFNTLYTRAILFSNYISTHHYL